MKTAKLINQYGMKVKEKKKISFPIPPNVKKKTIGRTPYSCHFYQVFSVLWLSINRCLHVCESSWVSHSCGHTVSLDFECLERKGVLKYDYCNTEVFGSSWVYIHILVMLKELSFCLYTVIHPGIFIYDQTHKSLHNM